MILDKELAKKGLESHLDFWEVTKITDDAAEVLSKHESEKICLNGLTKLSDAAAESIGKYKGRKISLDGPQRTFRCSCGVNRQL